MSLLELVDNQYTDKNTVHSYLPLYQTLFESKRESAKNVLEVGIFSGGSIKLWSDFFTNATIYGLDVEDVIKSDIKNNAKINLVWGDAYNPEFFKQNFSGIEFDILVDDGPHTLDSMKQFITLYSQVMADDGILVIEDVQDWSWISELTNTVPDSLKPYIKTYDLRANKGRYDDIVFTIHKSMLDSLLKNITLNKIGAEIGGPSPARTIYPNAKIIDNIIFSKNTIWSNHNEVYNYYNGKTGKVIINDATNIDKVSSNTYDFVFASHSLEHIANPIKALKEWIRITKPGGNIILVLPEKSVTFDHNRNVSTLSTLVSQYEKNVGEDDLSTLNEILEKHDLSMDPPAGSYEEFKRRSLDNFKNRCLHHYVYNSELLREICDYLKCEFIYTETDGINIWFIMKTPYINKTLVSYVFHQYNDRVQNFIDKCIFYDEKIDFLIIINSLEIEINVPKYVKVLKRENIGYDFGGWSDGLLNNDLYKNYGYFIFVNSSVIGPYIPMYYKGKWTDIFLDGLTNDIKLFGCTINTCQNQNLSHVQSYLFSMNRETLAYLIKSDIFSKNYVTNFDDAIWQKEVAMSRKIIDNQWNIGCLMNYYNGVDFRKDLTVQPLGDMMYPESFKTNTLTSHELVFIKGNRVIHDGSFKGR